MRKWKELNSEQIEILGETFRGLIENYSELHNCDMPRVMSILSEIHKKGYFIDLHHMDKIIKIMDTNLHGEYPSKHLVTFLQYTCYTFYFLINHYDDRRMSGDPPYPYSTMKALNLD